MNGVSRARLGFLSYESLTRWTSSRYLGPVTLVLAVLGLTVNEAGYQAVERLTAQTELILEARTLSDRVRLTTLMMESAKRGYVITERDAYLEPYLAMDREIDPLLEQMRALAETYPEQRERLQALVEAVRRKRSEMAEVLQRFQSGNKEGAMDLTLTEIGRENMVLINQIADEIRTHETEAHERVGALRKRVRYWSRIGIAGLVLLCVAAAFAVMRLGRARDREREYHLAQLSAERDKLEGQVERRTRDLTDLARHLQNVREDERGRLARELHDELGGLLTAAKLDVARVRKRIDASAPDVAERIQHLSQTLDAGIALKRRIIEDLRPSSLANLGLKRALEIQCSEFAKRSELQVRSEVDNLQLEPDRALAVYRLVQEALTNVAKYAQATEVRVLLKRVGDRAQLQVHDNGRGFDPKQVGAGSHGLAGMRFRMRSCGGDLSLRSAPGQGTTIEASLPI